MKYVPLLMFSLACTGTIILFINNGLSFEVGFGFAVTLLWLGVLIERAIF